ncbi:hypothetical protein T07_4261 [Trichinella nelsoni]|uniref:LEM domain-containing protein n=1 Tax=Trichinella nelsoni TaxID=6336 RepID=A0A0V0RMH9_9BILA|nr:hypothetical protein T07_4261 [Trichinella nelsoni]
MAKKSVSPKDDDEIYRKLRELGQQIGPVTDTTRWLYLKRLGLNPEDYGMSRNLYPAAEEVRKRRIGAPLDKSTEQLNKDNQLEGSETVRTFEGDPFELRPIVYRSNPCPPPKKYPPHGLITRRIPIVRKREPELEQNKNSGWNITNVGMLALFAVFFVVFIYMLIYRVKNDT